MGNDLMDLAAFAWGHRQESPEFIPDTKSSRDAASLLTGTGGHGASPGKPGEGRR